MPGINAKHLRWLTIAAGVMGTLGCGGRASDEHGAPPLAEAPRPAPSAQPPSAMAALPRPEAAPLPALAPAPVRPPPSGQLPDSECSCATDSVENVLAANCGQCHGPRAPVAGSAGITFIDDLDRLVAAGLLVPLNSAASPVVIVMVSGSMPPPASGLPQVTDADIGIVTSYLDNPRFWPEVAGSNSLVRDAGSGSPVRDAGSSSPVSDAGGGLAP